MEPGERREEGGDGPPGLEAVLGPLCDRVRERTGNDLSGYKRTTIGRRVERRMAALGLEEPADYLARATTDPDEPQALLREVLVSVTRFFREGDALEALPLDALAALPELRVWVCGCATGEEAYSLAILLLERRPPELPPPVVFATDLDEDSLAVARAGRYPATIAAEVSAERLARFFAQDEGGYVVHPGLRDACVFGRHNLLHDPPFSRLALVSCRNLLIYLQDALQARLLPTFHFALSPQGVLLLGAAESADPRPDLFEPLHRRHRVYRRLPALGALIPFPVAAWTSPRPTPPPAPRRAAPAVALRAVERLLLEQCAPPSVVVDVDGAVVYLCGACGPYLEAPRGPAPFDLLSLVRAPLQRPLRAGLAEARATDAEVRTAPVQLDPGTEVLVTVRPLRDLAPTELLLVLFSEARKPSSAGAPAPEGALVEQLERELRVTREHWRATQRELEATNEELRRSNEGYQALNEELHTSREELQSINEELQSVNAELRRKIDALDETHGDLENLFDATDVGALVLDGDGRIRRFTPSATELFPVRAADVGRPLRDIVCRAPGLALGDALRTVAATGAPVAQLVERSEDGARFAVRALPYRTTGGSVTGVVVTFVDVTQVERAVRTARDREADLVQVLEAVPALVLYTHDPDARRVSGNRVAATYLGAEGVDGFSVLGTGRRVIRDGRELTRSELAITRAARGETLRDFETTLEYPDGTARRLFGNAEPLRDSDGQLRGGVAAFVDVTERFRAEAASAASEARYRTLASTALDYISRFDRDLRFLYANPSVLERMQARLDDVVGTTSGQPAEWQAEVRRVFETGSPSRFDWEGDGAWFDVQLSPELEGGRVASVVSVARDITAQKAAERALRLSEQRYAAVFAVAAFGVLVLQRASTIVLAVNPALEEILGRPAAEVVGRTVAAAALLPDAERDRLREALRASRSLRGFPTVLTHREKGPRDVEVNLDVVVVDQGELLVMSVHDVTEARRAVEERERLERGLAHAQKMEAIGTLAGGVAHDFNNILAGLQGGLSLIESATIEPAVRTEVNELQALLQRGTGLTRQLLGFARGGKYDVKPLALAEAVERTASMFGQTRRDLVVELTVPRDLAVSMDRSQLEQVLLNLFVNAGHAMPAGGRLTVRAWPGPDRWVALSVGDTGVGMSEEVRSRIFEPFFTTKAPGEGTGLGLASVYGIVTNHGGTISVESAPGQGTTFTLQLPAADLRPPLADAAPAPLLRRGQGTLLVVDDEPQLLRVFARTLEAAGYTVLTAERGRDAVEIVRRRGRELSAVLLDLTMPELGGAATFEEMRRFEPELVVILCSGYGADGTARELMARGCAAFLQKPFTPRELTATLARVLPHRAAPGDR